MGLIRARMCVDGLRGEGGWKKQRTLPPPGWIILKQVLNELLEIHVWSVRGIGRRRPDRISQMLRVELSGVTRKQRFIGNI